MDCNIITDEDLKTVEAIAAAVASGHTLYTVDRDDLIQVGLLAYWRKKKTFDASKGFSLATHVGKRVRGAMLDLLRDEWKHQSSPRVEPENLDVPEDTDEQELVEEAEYQKYEVLAAAEVLPEKEVMVLLLKLDSPEKTNADVAKEIGKTERTVKRSLRKARIRVGALVQVRNN